MRSVPIVNQTFFLQICLYEPNAAVYGIEFIAGGTAVTPFTLVPMSANTAAAGTRVAPNGQGTTQVFGVRNFQSKESYAAAARCRST